MKKIFYLFIAVFSVQSLFAADTDLLEVLSDELSKGKVLDVYQKLEKMDPSNRDTDIFLTKLNLALNLYVVQIQYEKFGFVNLAFDQKIEDIRGKSGKYTLFSLPAHRILDSLVAEHPEDARLYKAQTDYLYECFLNYSPDMPLTDEQLLSRLEVASRKAIELKSADYETYFILGYTLLGKNQFEEAQRMLKKSLELNASYTPVYYNLSYAEFALKNFQAAIQYARKAWELYTDENQKGDAVRMLGFCYDNQNQTDSAIFYIKEGLKLNAKNGDLLLDYLHIAVREQMPEAEKLILEIILLKPESPEVYNGVMNVYYQEADNYLPVLKTLNELEKIYPNNDKIMANVNFYQGQILFEISTAQAKEKFKKAESYFLKFYPPTHEVFGVIRQYLETP